MREPLGNYNHTLVRTRGNDTDGVPCGLRTPARPRTQRRCVPNDGRRQASTPVIVHTGGAQLHPLCSHLEAHIELGAETGDLAGFIKHHVKLGDLRDAQILQ